MFCRTIYSCLLVVSCLISFCIYGKETRILTFDGGGVRGVCSLELLRELEKDTGIQVHKDIDVYAGTSTGAVIAVFLACGLSIDELLEEYEKLSSDIFSDPNSIFTSLFYPKYDQKNLRNGLKQLLRKCGLSEDILVRDLPKKVVIPTVNLDDPQTHRWKLDFRENLDPPGGGNLSVVDALLETTAAPIYFSSQDGHVDGGMGMNDPSVAAVMFAYDPQKSDLREFTLLSIGTGYNETFIAGDEDWGTAQWLATGSEQTGAAPFLQLLMDVQEQASGQVCAELLGDRYRKIDFPLPEVIELDDYEQISTLIKYTQEFILKDQDVWKQTCLWVSDHFSTRGM